MRGSVRFTIRVGPDGEVVDVTVAGGGGLSRSAIECMQARFRAARFAPPDGAAAIVVAPVTCVP